MRDGGGNVNIEGIKSNAYFENFQWPVGMLSGWNAIGRFSWYNSRKDLIMTLMVPLSTELEAKLRARAAAEGKDPGAYASKIIEQAISRSSIDEVLRPLREQFAASGTTDEELLEQINEARYAYRNKP